MKTTHSPRNRNTRAAVLSPCLATLLILWTGSLCAHGALAVGVPESVAKDGISVGFAWNAPSSDLARIDAIRSCLDLKTAPAKARALCNVITTFRYQCFSVAMDAPGGDGWGWAVERSLPEAERRALQACKSTVQKSCYVAFGQCDDKP
jgi:hypothetical protein